MFAMTGGLVAVRKQARPFYKGTVNNLDYPLSECLGIIKAVAMTLCGSLPKKFVSHRCQICKIGGKIASWL